MEEAGAPVYDYYMPGCVPGTSARTQAAARSQLDEDAAGLAPGAFGRLVAWIATVSTCI